MQFLVSSTHGSCMKWRHVLSKLHIEKQTHLLKSGVGYCNRVTHSCCQLVRYNLEVLRVGTTTALLGMEVFVVTTQRCNIHFMSLDYFFGVQKKNWSIKISPTRKLYHLTSDKAIYCHQKWVFDRDIPFVYLPWCLNPWCDVFPWFSVGKFPTKARR